MKALVTGVAGFIGSSLSERLVADGHQVVGVDCFSSYYSRQVKERHLGSLINEPGFRFVEADLLTADLPALLDGVDVVFHQAAQPGVRLSWAEGFSEYVAANVTATQRLLEAARTVPLQRFVYASSSSVYGNSTVYPTTEQHATQPHSPYGVTKLAAEHLCTAYATNFAVPTVSLRYFTVYGPRQRPDMALQRFVESALTSSPVSLFGDGKFVRDFTFISDVVAANVAAATADIPPGAVFNIAGGGSISIVGLLDEIASAAGQEVVIIRQPEQPGDVARTGGDISKAARYLGWEPSIDIRAGVKAQVDYQRAHPALAAPGRT